MGIFSLNTLIPLPETQKIKRGKHFTCEACEKGKNTKPPAINRPRASGQKEFSKEFM
jgi:hypothetical protein